MTITAPRFGIDRLLADPALRAPLGGRRVALLAHPASVTRDLTHALDALAALPDAPPPSAAGLPHLLSGLDTIGDRVADILSRRRDHPSPRLHVV